MKYLVHIGFPYYTYHSLITLNFAQGLLDKGHTVILFLCNQGVEHCYGNPMGDVLLCKYCKKIQKTRHKLLRGNYRVVNLSDYLFNSNPIQNEDITSYDGVEELKGLEYRGVKIGLSAYSSYVSLTRNLNPAINDSFKLFFNRLLISQIAVIDSLFNIYGEEKFHGLVCLNARHFEVRPYFDFANNMELELHTLESGYSVENKFQLGFDYGHFQPNSIEFFTKQLLESWDQSSLTNFEKIEIGENFYRRKKKGISTGDRVYTKDQVTNLGPVNWNYGKKNIVVFLSSEDEFVAIGDEYNSKKIFNNQMEGIYFICEAIKKIEYVNLFIRIHPNLKDVNYSYHWDLLKLSDLFKNVTIIKADSSISSYYLLENCDTVITFGSTIGIEAVWQKKPLILLSGSFYYHLDVAYIPKNKNDLVSLLSSELESKINENVYKFGFFQMMDRGFKLKYFYLKKYLSLSFLPKTINGESFKSYVIRSIYSYLFSSAEVNNKKHLPKDEDKAGISNLER